MCDLPGITLTALSLTYLQSPPFPLGWAAAAVTLVLFILAAAALSFFLIRRPFGGRESQESRDPALPKPSMDNPSAFMAASMQAVIQKLREQEKELAALHRRDRERAQQTERLSEAVTRNMPAGLLLISSAGLVTSANPAAEAALGELSAGSAHEFKNALATISGYAQMIRRESEGETAENAQLIVDQTRALTHVVTEFLRFARPLDLSTEEVPLRSVIDRVVDEI